MTMILSDEERMLRESASGVLKEQVSLKKLRELRSDVDSDAFEQGLWRQTFELGWTGVLAPAEQDGLDCGLAGAVQIAIEIGRTLAPLPFISAAVMAVAAVRASPRKGDADLLRRILSGSLISAIAVGEDAGNVLGSGDVTAVPGAGRYCLSGHQPWVVDGHLATSFIVSARLEGARALFLVPRDAPGVTIERRQLVDMRSVAHVSFDDVAVSEAETMATGEAAERTHAAMLDAGRVAVAAELVGVAEEAFERTVDYMKQRRQFDRTIGSFQALQHRAAQMFCELENMHSAVMYAARLNDAQSASAPLATAVAKAKASDGARMITAECLQLHGGIGMTEEFDIGLFLKRARVSSQLYGDGTFHADRVATMLGY